MNKTCIIIAGPTASGKTSIAIDIARQINTEIISADSRQCFHELNIGVAKPSTDQLDQVYHHFISSHSMYEPLSAALFEEYALNAAEKIFQLKDTVVMTGGTGLYIKAFCDGLDPVPQTDEIIRQQIIKGFKANGMQWLQDQVRMNDPDFLEVGEMDNPQRLMRALEVKLATGRSINSFHSRTKKKRNFRILKFGLDMPRDILYDRINNRVDQMIYAGLVEEARSLFPHKELNSLQTVGYRELFDHFGGKHSLERAISLIKQNSRQYAKRQLTWFRKDAEIQWLDALDPVQASNSILNYKL